MARSGAGREVGDGRGRACAGPTPGTGQAGREPGGVGDAELPPPTRHVPAESFESLFLERILELLVVERLRATAALTGAGAADGPSVAGYPHAGVASTARRAFRRAELGSTAPGSTVPGPQPAPTPARDEASQALPFAVGDRLAAASPGPGLAAELAALDVAALDVDASVEAVAAWERVVSWATARQAELVRSLVAHESRLGRGEFAEDAVAARLRVTRRAAQRTVERAVLLGEWPEVAELLAEGRLDAAKAGAVVTTVADVPRELGQAVLDTVLPSVPDVTAPVARARLRAAALAVEPALAQARAASEAGRRGVRLTPAPDAMAFLTFYLPADDASICLTAIDALSAAARTPEDPRSADARRADALTDLLRAVLDAGRTPSGVELPTQQHRRPHIQVTVAATTLMGLDDQPAELDGYGPIPAEMARRIAADGTWRRLVLDPATGQVLARDATTYRPGADLAGTVIARDRTCTFPGCRVPARRCDLDHVDPFRPGRDPADQTAAHNLQPLCRHHHRLKTHTDWTVRRDPVTGRTTWTTPWGRELVTEPEALPRPGGPPGPSRTGPAQPTAAPSPTQPTAAPSPTEPTAGPPPF